ncbi:NAD(P)H-hydrate dehydratase [Dissulfurispira sp.]|uniref:NAD(P)H-hydrate dehydratase n=1 Tax=Dissulfurispira sp. TaxID=2817609 RepID=UPI002FDAB26A
MVYANRDEAVKVVTAQEMREIDRITIEDYGIPGLVLMERAGLAVASKVREFYPDKKVLVLCGGGNNGGDGLVAARNLHNRGFDVKVFLAVEPKKLSSDALVQYKIARKFGLSTMPLNELLTHLITHHCLIVDAIFGTGLSRPVKGSLAEVFSLINDSDIPVVAVDIPSGISSDTGEVLGEAIKADFTVTFGLPKRGHLLYPGAEYAGRLFVEDIGFPAKLLASEKINVELIDIKMASDLILPRPGYSHKGDYGHVLVIAGSKGKTGAALMAAKACLRSGSGLVTLAVPESLLDVFQGRVTEEMTLPLPDDGSGMLSSKAIDVILNFAAKKIDVIAIGPGIGVSHDTEKVVMELIQRSSIPLVIDADGINSISRAIGNRQGTTGLFKKAKAPIILTPHPGEMARLLQGSREVEKNRIDTAISFSKETGAYLVLKGVPTIVAEPDGNAFINTTGNPGMATAGSGDVLTGVIASLLGQGSNPLNASLLGVYLHGLAGDAAAREKGEHSLIASDIIDFLPAAFVQLLDS